LPDMEGAAYPLLEEARLLGAIRSALSTPKGWFVVRLQLSRLTAPMPRPHHRRIARVILNEVAQHNAGEAFELDCGDMVLLCRALTQHGVDAAVHPAVLPHTLSRLFRQNVPADQSLANIWNLERDGAAVLGYVTRLVG